MNYVAKESRSQIKLVCFDELIESDSVVRKIDVFVDKMDTSYFVFAVTNDIGRPAYDPKDMLKLYIYGMFNKVFSSRKLERACKINIEVKWLLSELTPESKTICNFRKQNAENFSRFFNDFAKMLFENGYIAGELFGIDGTKMRANNAKSKNFSIKRLDERLEKINQHIEEYKRELDKNDKLDGLVKLKNKYESYKEKIQSGEVNEVSVTDPDCRMMKANNGGRDVCYNVHTAVDAKNKLVAGFRVKNKANDFGQLHDSAKDVKDRFELESFAVTADKGYFETAELKKCHEEKIETHVPKPAGKWASDEHFNKAQFTYKAEKDSYTCPAGSELPYAYTDKLNKRIYRSWKTCQKCPIREQCTVNACRSVSHHEDVEHESQNEDAMKLNPQIYEKRKEICEHPFGTIKKAMGYTQFYTRGFRMATGEMALILITYNLKRLINIQKSAPEKGEATVSVVILIIYAKQVI